MRYSDKLRKAEKKVGKRVEGEVRETITKIARGINEVRVYLDEHGSDKTPMSYEMVEELFGNLNEKHLSRIFRNALRGKV